jgi:polyisoprenoid-binding protein YceI
MNLMLLFVILAGVINPGNPEHVVSRKADLKASVVSWTGYKVTGKHYGKVSLRSGELQMDHGTLVGGSFTIDMNTISCEDLSGDSNGKLVGHLKSDDFFGVEKFPTASLKITRAIPQGEGKYKVLADLTIKNTTKPVRFNATISTEAGKDVAVADIKVDRSEYDVRYGSGSFFDQLGDKTIYDEFDLSVRLVLN